jgi:hypothetical protein
MVLATASNDKFVGVNVQMISPAMSAMKILQDGKQGIHKEMMSQMKALSTHFPNTLCRCVQMWVKELSATMTSESPHQWKQKVQSRDQFFSAIL